MVICAAILAVVVLVAIGWRRKPHRGRATAQRMNAGRDVLTAQEYLADLQEEARSSRCPHPAYKGSQTPCRRAGGRPCVRGCTGRTDLSTRWHG